MGMYDSLYDATGNEWQTKAFRCKLDSYRVGERILWHGDCQVEVLGGPDSGPSIDSFATIRDGVLAKVPDERDDNLMLLDYFGAVVPATKEA